MTIEAKDMDNNAKLNKNKFMSTLTNLIVRDDLLEVFSHISRAFGFRTSIMDSSFHEVEPLQKFPLRSYCRIVQESLGQKWKCKENDRDHCSLARESGQTLYYTCHAGLAEAVYPLFVDKHCIGYIFLGQFRLETSLPDGVLKLLIPDSEISEGTGLSQKKLKKALRNAYTELPYYDEEKLSSVLELLKIHMRYILEYQIVSVRKHILVDKVIECLKEWYTTGLTLEKVALRIGVSKSTISHTLKRLTGRSFTQHLHDIQLEQAAILLRTHHHLSIAEIAETVGFSDPFYFSRIFKKVYSLSPRAYRRRLILGEQATHPTAIQ